MGRWSTSRGMLYFTTCGHKAVVGWNTQDFQHQEDSAFGGENFNACVEPCSLSLSFTSTCVLVEFSGSVLILSPTPSHITSFLQNHYLQNKSHDSILETNTIPRTQSLCTNEEGGTPADTDSFLIALMITPQTTPNL